MITDKILKKCLINHNIKKVQVKLQNKTYNENHNQEKNFLN